MRLHSLFEAPEQVRADIALGFPYHEGDVQTNTYWNRQICDVGGEFPPTLCSKQATESWISDPMRTPRTESEWTSFDSADFWRNLLLLEGDINQQSFLTRRERRLNAWFPIR